MEIKRMFKKKKIGLGQSELKIVDSYMPLHLKAKRRKGHWLRICWRHYGMVFTVVDLSEILLNEIVESSVQYAMTIMTEVKCFKIAYKYSVL